MAAANPSDNSRFSVARMVSIAALVVVAIAWLTLVGVVAQEKPRASIGGAEEELVCAPLGGDTTSYVYPVVEGLGQARGDRDLSASVAEQRLAEIAAEQKLLARCEMARENQQVKFNTVLVVGATVTVVTAMLCIRPRRSRD